MHSCNGLSVSRIPIDRDILLLNLSHNINITLLNLPYNINVTSATRLRSISITRRADVIMEIQLTARDID